MDIYSMYMDIEQLKHQINEIIRKISIIEQRLANLENSIRMIDIELHGWEYER